MLNGITKVLADESNKAFQKNSPGLCWACLGLKVPHYAERFFFSG